MKREPRINLPIKKPAKVDQPEPRWQWSIAYFLLMLLILWGWQDLFYQLSVRTIPYSQFKTYLARHEVVAAIVKQDEIDGRIVPSAAGETKNETAGANPTVSPSNENQKSNPTDVPNNQTRPSPAETH